MISINLDWATFKDKAPISYVSAKGNYHLFASIEDIHYTCVFSLNSSDAKDFEANYKDSATGL